MKVTLHMAVSIDGYVARTGGQTDWVSPFDLALFEKRCAEKRCVIMGRTTFEEVDTMDGVHMIVLTHEPAAHQARDGVTFVATPHDALAVARSLGHDDVLLAGGGTTNGALLKDGLINELFLSVHPVVLGAGVRLFGNEATPAECTLLDTERFDDTLVQLHYRVG